MLHEVLIRHFLCVFQISTEETCLPILNCNFARCRRILRIFYVFFWKAWFNFGQSRAKSFIIYYTTYLSLTSILQQMAAKIYFLDLLKTLQNNLIKKWQNFAPKEYLVSDNATSIKSSKVLIHLRLGKLNDDLKYLACLSLYHFQILTTYPTHIALKQHFA